MGIVMTTPPAQIDQYIDDFTNNDEAVIETFRYIGEQCANNAKENGSYTDRSGHLRASVGYVVSKNGNVILSGCFGNDDDGGNEGKEFAAKVVSTYHSEGIALVVVAGKNYASAVEAKNFNVISSAELVAERMIPQLMAKLGYKQ